MKTQKKFDLNLGLIFMLCLCALLAFSGCDNKQEQQPRHPGEILIGDWQIENQEGQNHTLFTYSFKDTGKVYMAMDNVAFGGDYTLGKTDDGKDTFATTMYYNLNGTYEFEFSDDNNTMQLTETSDGTSFKMKRISDFSITPEAPENPVIDQNLLGSWKSKSDGGILYSFDDKGIMTSNSYEVMIINAKYSAQDGKINLKYKQGSPVEDSYSYSLDGDVITIDGVEFVKE